MHVAREREAKRLRDNMAATRQLLVRAAFAAGFNGPEVAQAAGFSKERAYQVRNAYTPRSTQCPECGMRQRRVDGATVCPRCPATADSPNHAS